VVLLLVAAPALAQGSGRVEGRVVTLGGRGLGGVTVALAGDGVDRVTLTDGNGNFTFSGVPAGDYTLSYTLVDRSTTGEVAVASGATAEVSEEVDWDTSFADSITVYSASRQTERITEAPAAITVIPQEQIERESTSGQVPKLLEFTPGAEVTQSGLYDFNFNTRGFNSSLNRRILTLIDGRDPSVPFLGSQEWAAVSFPLDDLASLELVRGPGSALYGADAFNGVLNMVTKAPRYSQGGKVQLTGGDLDTLRGDVRVAGQMGGSTYFKLTGGYMESEDFAVSRNPASGGPEYLPCAPGQTVGCLTPEPVPLAVTEDKLTFGGARLDQYFGGGGAVLTLEGGTASIEGPVAQTGIGRVQLLDVERPWWRANFNTEHWNFLAYWNSRDAQDQLALRSGATLVLDSENLAFEAQGNWTSASDRFRLVGGASYKEEDIDSANDQGFQTLMFAPRSEDFTGVFGQLEIDLTDSLKAVLAARWDDSSLHDSQVSPRGSLVWAVTPQHSFRLTYAEAFQTPNYSEFFLRAPVALPLNLGPIEAALAPFLGGVPLGFSNVQVLAVGNPFLEPEEITSYEAGYTGIFGQRTYMTADYYRNDIENFITDLITRIQPALGGNINPAFGPYAPPAVLPGPVQAIIIQTLQNVLGPNFFVLSNGPDGAPILVPVSYVNFGEVETQGLELGLHHHFTEALSLQVNYSWFDFEVQQELAADPVIPNAPEHQYNLALAYVEDTFDFSVGYRWVDDFQWNAGVFRGPVPSYDVVSLTANYHFTANWGVGIDVSNALDEEHWQAFGGDILQRRALAHVNFSW
jgi:iron complex outermembrane receptor protein